MKQKKILIFNKHKKLVLVACSINEAARYDDSAVSVPRVAV